MKKILLIATLLLPLLGQALPFVPTTSPNTYPIHWYYMKTGNVYMYAGNNDGYDELMGSTTVSNSDAYLWCFVGTASTGYKIYNRATKNYMMSGNDFGSANESSVNYYEAGSGNSFYIYTMLTPWGSSTSMKNYLIYYNNEFYTTRSKANSYTVTEALVEDFIDPSGSIVFNDLETYEDHCVIDLSYTGSEQYYWVVFANGTEVTLPYSIARTDENQTVHVEVNVNFEDPRIYAIVASKNYEIPALESPSTELDLTLTPYDFNVPHNELDNYGNEGYAKLFDKNRNTKWCVVNSSGAWETIRADFKTKQPFYPTGYIFTTGNDTQSFYNRNPKAWKIYAKTNESDNWTTIVDVADGAEAGLGTNSTTDYSFKIKGVGKKYQYFRFEVSEIRGKDNWDQNNYVFQLAELELTGGLTIPGDVNGDGRVNVSDVSTLINMILGITTMDQTAADVNGDGRVNVSDVTSLINIILGIN